MNITFFILYCCIATITPGPTNITILATVQNYGFKKAIEFSFGSLFAFFLLLLVSVLFSSFISVYIPSIVFVMQVIGSMYIFYIAYLIYNMDISESKKEFVSFKSGFLLQFINPKSILFSVTIFPSFILPYYSDISSLMGFSLVITFIAASSFLSWILFGSLLKTFLKRYQSIINKLMSLVLVYCAIMILMMSDIVK